MWQIVDAAFDVPLDETSWKNRISETSLGINRPISTVDLSQPAQRLR
jgi:hypothetical protein